MTKFKGAVLAMLAGATMLSSGCLNLNWQRIFLGTAIYAGSEFLLDNDGVFDLFPDGDTTAAE
jgi:hypothetical protein